MALIKDIVKAIKKLNCNRCKLIDKVQRLQEGLI